jgi:hypothetical protein
VPVIVDNNKKRLYTLQAADTMALQIKNEALQYLLANEEKMIRFRY